jgi:hypothetical protein
MWPEPAEEADPPAEECAEELLAEAATLGAEEPDEDPPPGRCSTANHASTSTANASRAT